jgi:hypothetical protein
VGEGGTGVGHRKRDERVRRKKRKSNEKGGEGEGMVR